jgi:hypothetical protein
MVNRGLNKVRSLIYLKGILSIALFLLFTAYLLLIFSGCSKKVDSKQSPPVQTDSSGPRLSLDSARLHVSSKPSSTDSFSIASNVNWTISYNGDVSRWVQVSTLDGDHNRRIIVTTLTGNLADTLRMGTITISGTNDSLVHPIVLTLSQQPLLAEFPLRNVYGGTAYNILFGFVPSGDGGYVAIGSSKGNEGDAVGNHGSDDLWVIKVDASGNRVWQHLYGGSLSDIGYSITHSQDGGYLAVGSSLSNDFDVSGNNGGTDIWVIKMDANGNKQWTKCFGSAGNETGYSVVGTSDGGYIVSGGNYGMWLFKIDGNGNLIWQKFAGGSQPQVPLAGWWICHGADNGYIVVGNSTGISKGVIDTAQGGMDIWMAKMDENGDLLWNHEFGGTQDDIPYFVSTTPDGGYLITGSTNSFNKDVTRYQGSGDIWIIKTDVSGKMQWQKTFGGSGVDLGYSSVNIPGGGYLIGSITSSRDGDITSYHGGKSDGWLITLDAYGNLMSQKTVGGSGQDQLFFVGSIGSQKYMLAGATDSFDGDIIGASGYIEGWLMKF